MLGSLYRIMILLFFLMLNYSAHAMITTAATVGIATAWWLHTHPDTSLPTLNEMNIVTFLPVLDDGTRESMVITEEEISKVLRNPPASGKKIRICTSNQTVCYTIIRGIPDEIAGITDPITIYSGGYSNACQPYAYCLYTALKAGNVQGPCIVFENPNNNSPLRFNFCQRQDTICFDLLLKAIRERNPKAMIILYGACQGGANTLSFLMQRAQEGDSEILAVVKAAVIESPALCPAKAVQDYPLSHLLFRLAFPNYHPDELQTVDQATAFPTGVKILLGSLPKDRISALEDMQRMVAHLKGLGANVEHFISIHEQITHGKIGMAPDFQNKVVNFISGLNQ